MIQALDSRAFITLFHGPCAANLFMNLIGQSIRCWPPLIVVFGCSDKQPAFSQSLYEGLIAPSFPQALWELRFPQSLWERYTLTNHARRMASISNHYCWYFGTNCPPEKNVDCWYHYQSINGMNLSWIICANIIVEPGVRPGICSVMMQDTQSNETSDWTVWNVWNIPEVKKPGVIAHQNIEEWIFESLVNLTHFDI